MGDLNAHHTEWGSSHCNPNGRTVWDLITINNLVVLNDGRSTRLIGPLEQPSPLDITLVSASLASSCQWSTLTDCGNSDHFPTLCQINEIQYNTANNKYIRNFKKADWQKYNEVLHAQLQLGEDWDYNRLTFMINLAANSSIPLRQQINEQKRPKSPWWDAECDDKVRIRKAALDNFKNNPTLDNYIEAKKIRAVTNRFLKKKKKYKFKIFCNSLNRKTDISHIWKTVKKFTDNKHTIARKNFPNTQVALTLLQNLGTCNIEPEFSLKPIVNNIQDFHLIELEHCLKSRKDSAVGLDQISYSMLLNLPIDLKQSLLNIFNECLMGNPLPPTWKNYLILPFLKNNRDPSNPDNYRPLVLSSCPLKVLEHLLKTRLDWMLENKNIFHTHLTGFRQDHSTYDNLAFLVSHIHLAFSEGEQVLAVFLDIKSAYDNVNIYKLYKFLTEIDIPMEYCNLIFNILNHRNLYIMNNDQHTLGPIEGSTGLPQGSPLSPLLFNIYITSLFQATPPNIHLLSYADDLVLFTRGSNPNNMIEQMNSTIGHIYNLLRVNNLSISTQKSSGLLFSKGRYTRCLPPLLINLTPIQIVDQYKYLGVMLHKNLKWDLHIGNAITKANKGIRLLKIFSKVKWGIDPVTLLTLFNALVRPHLDYGSFLFQPASKRALNKLDTSFYQGLRVVIGCMKSTPKNCILAETAQTDLHHRRLWLGCKFLLKKCRFRDHPLTKVLNELTSHVDNHTGYWRNKLPPLLTIGYNILKNHTAHIYSNSKLPNYIFDLKIHFTKIPVVNMTIRKTHTDIPQLFLAHTIQLRQSHTFIFTDASKQGERCGIGVHIPQHNINYAERLPNSLSICTSEMTAIKKALEFISLKNILNPIIFLDSKSSVLKLSKLGIHSDTDYASLEIKNIIIELQNSQINTKLSWIPGHSKIPGNEVADRLAKIGAGLNAPMRMYIPLADILTNVKHDIKKQFIQAWKHSSRMKGKWYFSIQPSFPNKPWYTDMPYMDRRHITTIIRLRTGHGLYKQHLHKIGIETDPFCECGRIENLDHIFFECPIYHIQEFNLYEELQRSGITIPLNLSHVLHYLTYERIALLIKYITINKINL
ncbi:unnamed protein product [Callosobruchus maculatus]|uniref:Reverse transcriptase domain-containing protein n=1 Tax=Callosobruchus maculatus TaxID=64391 RepID=A0A653DBA6_CALMS|nr:unnamed protein product [Callosobruchus maculatus]